MADQIRVIPENLQLSAMKVEGHAEELHARHVASDCRIGDARAGVPVAAATALGAALAKWQLDTTVLHGRLAGHGQALGCSATAFAQAEAGNAADIEVVGDEGSASVAL